MAVDDDWLAVGAPFANGSGAVYIYRRDGGSLTLTQKLTAPDAARGDQFGLTLALSGGTLIVGAPNSVGTGGSLSGAVYVFAHAEEAWVPSQKLTAGDARPFDNFGFSLAIDGDTAVIGAPFHDGAAGNSGAAYVFERNGSSWSETARLKASDGAADDEYGSAVSVSGPALVVGARTDDVNGMRDVGSAYVYEKSSGGWKEVTHLLGEAAGDRFGVAASMSGDRLVIGALLHDGGTGAAYPFVRKEDGTWGQDRDLIPGDAKGGRFGQAVSLDGQNLLVGAYLANDGAGSACICPFPSPPPPPAPTADLSLASKGAPASVRPGDTITYTLTVTNQGPGKATGVRVQETIPSGLMPVAALLPSGCTMGAGAIDCSLGTDLNVGGKWVISLAFKAQETCVPVIQSSAKVFSNNDPISANNRVQSSTTLVRTADLVMVLKAPQSVRAGKPLPYGLMVTNRGPDVACGVVVVDYFPPERPRASSGLATECTVGTDWARCSIDELAARSSHSFDVVFTAPQGCGGAVVNTAMVSAVPSTADDCPGNDLDTKQTDLATDVSITKKADRDIAEPGQTLRYTIEVKNPDGCKATVEDIFPAALTSAKWCREVEGPCDPSSMGDLSDVVEGPATYDVQGTVDPLFIGTLSNTATVEGPPGVDGDLSNNSATYPTEIFSMGHEIPTLTEPWLAALALLLALLALRRLRLRAL